MICLDSDVIVDILRNHPEAVQKYDATKSAVLATTIINLYELLSGVWCVKDKNYQRALDVLNKFLENIEILPLDEISVEKAAKLYGGLSQNGRIIDDLDILIAAICISNNCESLITRNIKDFSRIKGLKVETY